MDAFKTHEKVISDYKSYLQSFINIKDQRILDFVNNSTLVENILPEPLIQFNPSFERGQSFDELIQEHTIHPNLSKALGSYRLYRHQSEAIQIGVQDQGFVVTSGTGSGKSLTFLATIFNDFFKRGNGKEKGVKAILVYPMNALINSQEEEIKKYKINYLEKYVSLSDIDRANKTLDEIIDHLEGLTTERFPITFAKYTGQESSVDRDRVKNDEPDILLTNYMMLELIMTRQSENWLRDSMIKHLKYLVYDELHTYRGRQGADVSFLNRRIQALVMNNLIFIGTSATMASHGSPEEKKKKVAEVATQIFGKEISYEYVINEYLEPCTLAKQVNPSQLADAVKKGISIEDSEEEFINNDLANWLEMNVALRYNQDIIERGKPLRIDQITNQIAETVTSLSQDKIRNTVIDLLKWAERINEDNRQKGTRKSFLPFRFHQFISQTGSISVTLEPRNTRYITSSDEPFVKIENKERKLYPLLFSRYSGYEFLTVELDIDNAEILPITSIKDFKNKKKDDINQKNPDVRDFRYGYIVLDEGEEFWNEDFKDLVPREWWNKGETALLPYYQMLMPHTLYFNSEGQFSFEPKFPIKGYFIPSPLILDPTCSIVYEDSRLKDSTKLARLGSEGRSTATSILSMSVIRSLSDEKLADQKLLSFTDNRQDASLQAGHFNDFYNTVRFRAGLLKSIKHTGGSIEVHELAEELLKALNLREVDYARNPSEDEDFGNDRNKDAIKYLLLYRAFQDLKRGWRYILPNLEQVGLIKIEYKKLEKLANVQEKFKGIEFLEELTAAKRYEILKNILDYFRTNFALDHRFFDNVANIETLIKDLLDVDKPWSLGIEEKLDKPRVMVVGSIKPKVKGIFDASIGVRSSLGKYLNRERIESGLAKLKKDEYELWINGILKVLCDTNFIRKTNDNRLPNHDLYKLIVDNITWIHNDDGIVEIDKTRLNYQNELLEIQPNPYFKKLYQFDFSQFKKELIAKEHTGQIGAQERINREDAFRKGEISTLYCSPTMELGIDIANLNIVHMRNVPPNAANYAQRSGRAGRGGQTALVFTYCSTMSPHDVNYFNNSSEMVAGIVQPPRIDLINEELIVSHLNAFLLMKLEIKELKTSAADVLDLSDERNVFLKHDILERIEHLVSIMKKELLLEFEKIAYSLLPELDKTVWFTQLWILDKIEKFPAHFDFSFKRWIKMFQNACMLRNKAQAILDNHTYKSDSTERKEAAKQERFARKQIALLKNEEQQSSSNSEFYVFRYLAAEGFLPGYNFTRLPVRAVLGKSYQDDVEVISRPRALALSEFGPLNTVYHSGNKFRLNRMMVSDIEHNLQKIKVSSKTGYAFMNEEIDLANIDPINRKSLVGDAMELYTKVIELSECEGIPLQKISCIEEERSRSGYEVASYFNFPHGIENTESVVLKKGGEKLLQLYFSKTASLIKLNKKARRSQQSGFKIDQRNGVWIQERNLNNNQELIDNTKEIMLFTKDTADVLYIQPLGNIGTTPDQVVSLSYALKRGIEKLFLVEESEMAVSVMGDKEKPNILIHEASEGSLGILSQLMDPPKMKEWFKITYEVLHFDLETREETEQGKKLPHATYQDLLSYYNQIYHQQLNRHIIKEVLEYLIDCDIEIVQGGKNDREEQYRYLLEAYDKNSSTELKLIRHLYENGYSLPDRAQVNLDSYYINADFVFKTSSGFTLIFCDGSIHDLEEVKKRDQMIDQILKQGSHDIVRWHYTESLEDLIKRRKDIFRKVQ
ncbi:MULTISPECIES: DEAD/DEAH box helicase [Elizabethkingia]|uniref:DEAD/DEAH box helicase n=1 Tax=Elizabethkingia TaxID=308865 RepID=UPI0021A9689E|nr:MULTISPECIES: DEAD/DEAH box helicase [Elizabethkingia]MCT3765543.1 DEAD/DEAH box helicase [Elizabethkingia anophelis]MCT4051080.1 DEAD/DEAH box helicase [Elizabethkingia anophelis]MCT4093980.1 DEAD/DEAH box helicase [Elizabethkingia anophelis]MCT4160778.1 DEAD/DEAH box helicase [Elizabethkingia anophelis]MCT4185550.1 DEAD/DEAH box helicase [Elizabethkingia anophelis]